MLRIAILIIFVVRADGRSVNSEDNEISEDTRETAETNEDNKEKHVNESVIEGTEYKENSTVDVIDKNISALKNDMVKEIKKEVVKSITAMEASNSSDVNMGMLKRIREHIEKLKILANPFRNLTKNLLFHGTMSQPYGSAGETYEKLMKERADMQGKINKWLHDVKKAEETFAEKKRLLKLENPPESDPNMGFVKRKSANPCNLCKYTIKYPCCEK